MQLSPPTCVETLAPGDGGAIDGDPRGDAPDGIDAPPPGACVADTDCAGGICHELEGACVPDAEVLFVAPSGTGTTCTRAMPCGTLQVAIDARTQARYTVALAAGTYTSSFDTVAMPGGVDNLVVSGPTRAWGDAVIMTSAMNRVHAGLEALFEGLTIRGGGNGGAAGIDSRGATTLSRVHVDLAADDGVVCAGGSMTILDSQITKSASTGVYASSGALVIQRTQVVGNGVYGIHVDGSSFTIVNSIIASNGKAFMQTGGARLRTAGGGDAVFRFNTFARNLGITSPALTCDNAVGISNVIVGEQAFITPAITASCSATYSLFNVSAGAAPPGTGNITGDPMFVGMNDFHIQAGSPAIDKANPTGAEPIDIDGQQRIAPPDIGADERP